MRKRPNNAADDSGPDEDMEKVPILIRARSVVQVHPGPPFTFSRLPSLLPQIPTHNWPHASLDHLRSHSQRRPCFIAVVLRIQVERRLNLRVTQDALHGFGFDFRLVHQPVAK